MPFVSDGELKLLRQLQADVNAGLWVRKAEPIIDLRGTEIARFGPPLETLPAPDRTLAIVPPRHADDLPENIAEACKFYASSPKAIAANCAVARRMLKQGANEEAVLAAIQQGRAV